MHKLYKYDLNTPYTSSFHIKTNLFLSSAILIFRENAEFNPHYFVNENYN